MVQKILEIIEYENESHKVDFKKVEYSLGREPKKNEILKDFLSFVNHISDDDKYIIIGVKELQDKTKEINEIDSPTDEAKYRQFINEYIEPQINFEYGNLKYKNKTICYFRIFNNFDRPYLIKKECKNPINGKTDFKYGDGFIRIGTSTKKIGRKEIDDILRSKQKYNNRKNDIIIKPIVGTSENEEVSKWNVQYLDINIENISNKSIELDVEMNIFKKDNFELLTESEFISEIEEKENQRKKANSPYPISFTQIKTPILNNHTTTKVTDEIFGIQRNPIKSKYGITIPQNSVFEDVFLQSVILLQNSENIIEAEVIIRSDDFIDGALKKTINFNT